MSTPKAEDYGNYVEILIDKAKGLYRIYDVKLDSLENKLSFMYYPESIINNGIRRFKHNLSKAKKLDYISIPKSKVYIIKTYFDFDGLQIFDNASYSFKKLHNDWSIMKVRLSDFTKIIASQFIVEINDYDEDVFYYKSGIKTPVEFAAPVGGDLSQWIIASNITCENKKIIHTNLTGSPYVFDFFNHKTKKNQYVVQFDLNIMGVTKHERDDGFYDNKIVKNFADNMNPIIFIRSRQDEEGDYKLIPEFSPSPVKSVVLKEFVRPNSIFPNGGWRAYYFDKEDLQQSKSNVDLTFKSNPKCHQYVPAHLEMVVHDGLRVPSVAEKLEGRELKTVFPVKE